MNKKKEPPDLRLFPLDSPIDRSSLIDLAICLLISRFRSQPVSFPCSLFVFGFSVVSNSSSPLRVCDGTSGYNPGRAPASKLGSAFPILGTRSAITERRCHDWKIYSVSLRRVISLFLRQPQVCSFFPYLLRLV